MAQKKEKKVLVRQTRSGTGHPAPQRVTLEALGLGRIGKSREHIMTPSTLGMLRKVAHLIEVSEVQK